MRRFAVLLCVVTLATSCSVLNTEVVDLDWFVQTGEREIEVGSQCGGTYPSVEESDTAVVVTVRVNRMNKNDCGGTTTIELERPLGDRTVLDGYDSLPVDELDAHP